VKPSQRRCVEDELQDEQIGWDMRSRLFGKVRSSAGADRSIKVLRGGWLTIQCRVFVDDTLIFSSGR
jgi:hypothetical protein